MQPKVLQRRPESNSAFKILRNGNPYVHHGWHCHAEVEIVYIEKGKGTRFIGDSIQTYYNGDLVLVGAHLPHHWKSEIVEDGFRDSLNQSIALYFSKEFPGMDFYELPEMEKVKVLLEQSVRGISVMDLSTKEKVYHKLCQILGQNGVEKILTFSRY